MKNIEAVSPQQFRAVVFKRLPTSEDFSQSQAVALPGRQTAAAAWSAVHAAMRADPEVLGGEIAPCERA